MILSTVKIEDFERFWNTSRPTALRSESSTGPGVRMYFAIPMTPTGCGCSWTAMKRAIRTSCPIPRCRRSSRMPDSKAGPRWRSWRASRTPSSRPPLPAAFAWLRSSRSARRGRTRDDEHGLAERGAVAQKEHSVRHANGARCGWTYTSLHPGLAGVGAHVRAQAQVGGLGLDVVADPSRRQRRAVGR
jgi:hypothetical protein